MTEVVKTEVLPAIFSKVDKIADMQEETTDNLTENDLDCMQFCKEMPSQGSVSEAAVMVEESESSIYGPADILPIMDSLDLVTRGQEEKQNRVSLHIEANVIDNTDYIQGGTTKVEESLNKVEDAQLVEDHYLEEEKMLDASRGVECMALHIRVRSEPVQYAVNQSTDSVEHLEDYARVRVAYDGAEYVVDAELGKRDAACEDPLYAAAKYGKH